MANPAAGQFLRQIRPVAITSATSLQSQGVVNTTTPTIVQATIPHAPNVPSTSISAVQPILNNSTIRVRLPDTPTLPTVLQPNTTQIVQQQGRHLGPISSSNTNISAVVKPTNAFISAPPPLQTQQVQHPPRMVTIQGNQVIINQQVVGQSPQAVHVHANSANPPISGTLIAPNNPGVGLTAIRPGQQISSPASTASHQQQPFIQPPKVVQQRQQQISSGNNIIVGNASNMFRVPTCGPSSPATVIVDASGIAGQTTQLPHTAMVRLQH